MQLGGQVEAGKVEFKYMYEKIYINMLFKIISSPCLQVNIHVHLYSGALLSSHKYITENCHSPELFSLYGTQDAPLHTRHI